MLRIAIKHAAKWQYITGLKDKPFVWGKARNTRPAVNCCAFLMYLAHLGATRLNCTFCCSSPLALSVPTRHETEAQVLRGTEMPLMQGCTICQVRPQAGDKPPDCVNNSGFQCHLSARQARMQGRGKVSTQCFVSFFVCLLLMFWVNPQGGCGASLYIQNLGV